MKLGKKSPGRVNLRRISAKARLLINLDSLNKNLKTLNSIPEEKQEESHLQKIVDSEREISRIQNEINTLDTRIISQESAVQRKNKKYRATR